MVKKLAILNSENNEIVEAIKIYFSNRDIEVECFDKLSDISESYDLVVQTSFCDFIDGVTEQTFISIHPTLLPAFAEVDALQKSFNAGIKVGGITIYLPLVNNKFQGKILAQYPVLIGNLTHFDEYKSDLVEISKKLYPIVIESILEDKVFDFADLLKPSCSGGCGGCGSCHK